MIVNFLSVLSFLWSCALIPGDKITNYTSLQMNDTTPVAEVTVVKNGELLMRFNSMVSRALLDENHLSIELISSDMRHSLIIEIEDAVIGRFPIVKETKNQCAVVIFMGESIDMMLSPTKGYLNLEKFNNGLCSGYFAGELFNELGENFQINGKFESIVFTTL